jgi:hypothetical protein
MVAKRLEPPAPAQPRSNGNHRPGEPLAIRRLEDEVRAMVRARIEHVMPPLIRARVLERLD